MEREKIAWPLAVLNNSDFQFPMRGGVLAGICYHVDERNSLCRVIVEPQPLPKRSTSFSVDCRAVYINQL